MHVPTTLISKVPFVVNCKPEKFIFPSIVIPDITPSILFKGETDKEMLYDPEVTSEVQ